MATSTSTGSALYYPYLDLHTHAWLNLAALYYDHIWRIVPPGWDSWDSDDVNRYVDAGFLKPRSSEEAAEKVADEFEDFLAQTLDTPAKRAQLTNDLRLSRGIESLSVGKMIYQLALKLKAKGLLTESGSHWYRVEGLTGALYMLFLAKRLAGSLPLISDDSVFQQLAYGTPGRETAKDARGGVRTFRLASLVLKTVVPRDISAIPAEKILEVRRITEEERVDFHDTIASLGAELETIRDPRDAEDAIQHKQVAIARSIKGLRNKLRSQNIACVAGFMGISVPSMATATWGFNITNPIVLSGFGAVAAATFVAKSVMDARSAKLESHWTYLHSLKGKLKDYSVKEDLISLHLL